jgi:PAS domain S-box-containing protein/putative nucleotidyltransferase with HDIG domain
VSRGANELSGRVRLWSNTILQSFLWILLGVVGASLIMNIALQGSSALSLPALAPTFLLAAVIGVALWLNHAQRPDLAAWLVIGITQFSAILQLHLVGPVDGTASLLLFFLPLALVGLLLQRIVLFLTVALTLLAVLASPFMPGAGTTLGGTADAATTWGAALQFVLIYSAVALFLARYGQVLQASLWKAAEKELALEAETSERRKAQEELLERQKFTDSVFESLPGAFYVIDEAGHFVKWNRNLARTLGYTDDEIGQLRPVDIVPPKQQKAIAKAIATAIEFGHLAAEYTFITRDGQRIPYLFSGASVTLSGRRYLAGIGIDRSEIDAARTHNDLLSIELAERLERINALREIDTAISASLDLAHILDVVLDQVTKRLNVDAAAILLYDHDSQTLNFDATQGFNTDGLIAARVSLGQGISGHAALTRENVLVNSPAELARRAVYGPAVRQEGFHSSKAVPLIAKGQLQGVLQLFHRSSINLDDDWREFLEALATQAAIALDNARLLESLKRSNAELREAYDTTIGGWARALDLKDEETAGHSERVTTLTLKLARHLKIPEHELEHIRRGALLHDIGKMGVPDSILLKPGKLDAEEWVVMQQHTTYARDFLEPIPFLKPALDIPYAHHEKWDGSGYPRGLKGDEIPLAARIFAVIDVYDALTSDRPYRRAWSKQRALEHIQVAAGAHFDPTVVTAFLELMVSEPDAGRASLQTG